MIVSGGRNRLGGVLAAVAAAVMVALAAASGAAASSMVVQPDGKIVVLGNVWPQAGAIARLNPDGSLDAGFADKGFLLDRRAPTLRTLTLQPDGRLVAAAADGFLLTRYRADGSADPAFARGGVGGGFEAGQIQLPAGGYGPVAVAIQPSGGIVVAGNRGMGGGASDGWVKRYDSSGGSPETLGHLPMPGGPASMASLSSLLEAPDGSFLATGYSYLGNGLEEGKWVLARFVPGSGADYDSGFGAGAGLVQPALPTQPRFSTRFSAIAASGEKTLVAGRTAGTFLLARFNRDGTVDAGFGQNGFVAPPVTGPAAASRSEGPETSAADLAVLPGGDAILAGGTSQWGTWTSSKVGLHCSECPQPMLARVDAGGNLVPGFGSGGLLRLLKPDGSIIQGGIDTVVALADGKILVKGGISEGQVGPRAFFARLNPDGSYDPSFGDRGLATLRFPCTDQPETAQRRAGCVGSARATVRVAARGKRHPFLDLRLASTVPWAAIETATVVLPRGVELKRGFMSKLSVKPSAGDLKVSPGRGKVDGVRRTYLLLQELGDPQRLKLRLGRGAFTIPRATVTDKHRLEFEVGIEFVDSRWGTYAGHQALVRRAGG